MIVGNDNLQEHNYYIYKGTDAVDFRSKNIESIDSLQNNSIDFYASVKSLYLQIELKKFLILQFLTKNKMTAIGKKSTINKFRTMKRIFSSFLIIFYLFSNKFIGYSL